jgi:hypothetical protein
MASSRLRGRGTHFHVTIVSANPDTLDGLEAYLQRAGALTNGTRRIECIADVTPPASTAVLLFPDDFDAAVVAAALATLRAKRPTTLPVLVTKEPRRFARLPSAERGVAPLLVPKPVWGWMILDAIRARLDADLSAKSR